MTEGRPRKLKVAHLMGASMGARFIVFNQLKYLRDCGFEVHQICSPGPWLEDLEAEGIQVTTIPISRSFVSAGDVLSVIRLWRHFRAENYDLVHVHTAKAGFLGRLAAKLAGVPVIIWTNAGFIFHDNTPPAKRRMLIRLESLAARWCDLILSQNREDVETAVREGICERDKIIRLGNGIDLTRFDPASVSEAERQRLREELGFAPEDKVVGMIGRLVREKGFVEFIDASRIVHARVPNVKFLVVGPHEPEKNDALGPDIVAGTETEAATVFLAEMRTDVVELLSIMDVVALPSHREGMPRLPMEAGAMMKPAVVTDIRGCREVVADGVTGRLVTVGDATELAEAIIDILENPEEAEQFGMAARERVEEHFDERRLFERIAGHYDRLLGEKSLHDA